MKQQFYSAVDEQLLAYIYHDETNTCATGIPTTGKINKELAVTRAISKINSDYDICYIEDYKMRGISFKYQQTLGKMTTE